MSSVSTFQLDPALVLAGGARVPIVLLAGEQSEVLVRLLRAGEEYRTFVQLADDYLALADFVTGNAAGWAATLQPASVLDIADKALELNFFLARRSVELWAKLNAALLGGDAPPSPAASSPSRPSSSPTPA